MAGVEVSICKALGSIQVKVVRGLQTNAATEHLTYYHLSCLQDMLE